MLRLVLERVSGSARPNLPIERGPVVRDLRGYRGDELSTLGVVLQDGGEEVPRAMIGRWYGDGGGGTREVQEGDEVIAAKLRVVKEGRAENGDRRGGKGRSLKASNPTNSSRSP